MEKELRVAQIEYSLVKKWHDRLFPDEVEVETVDEEVTECM
jgi:hypothetical protein